MTIPRRARLRPDYKQRRMSIADGDDARPEQVAFQLALRLLRGETICVTDEIGRTWSATASTLSWQSDVASEVVLERADAFDILSELAERLSTQIQTVPKDLPDLAEPAS